MIWARCCCFVPLRACVMPFQVRLVADPLAAARDSQLSIFSHNKRQVLALQVLLHCIALRQAAHLFVSCRDRFCYTFLLRHLPWFQVKGMMCDV